MSPTDIVAFWCVVGLLASAYARRPSSPPPVRRGTPIVRLHTEVDGQVLARAVAPRPAQTDVHDDLRRATGGRR